MECISINQNEKQSENKNILKPVENNKANRIHLQLLSFVKNEINEKKKSKNSYFSFSTRKRNEIQQKVNDKYTNIKTSNIIQKSDDTNYSYNDKEEEEEDDESLEESSSEMSCEEEIII